MGEKVQAMSKVSDSVRRIGLNSGFCDQPSSGGARQRRFGSSKKYARVILRHRTFVLGCAACGVATLVTTSIASAANISVYLDKNGATAGSGVAAGNTSLNFGSSTVQYSTSAAGTSGTVKFSDPTVGGNTGTADLFFSAGTDADTVTYTVQATGTTAGNVDSLTFKDGIVTLSGSTSPGLNVSSGGVNVSTGITAAIAAAAKLNLVADQSWNVATGGSLSITSSSSTGPGINGSGYNLTLGGPGSYSFGGSGVNNLNSLTINGSTVTTSLATAFGTGALNLSSGSLSATGLTNSTPLTNASYNILNSFTFTNLTTGSNHVIFNGAGSIGTATVAPTITLSDTVGGGTTFGIISSTAMVTLNNAVAFTGTGNATFNSAIANSGNFAFNLSSGFSGTVTLAGTNAFGGGIIINGGTLSVGGASTIGSAGTNITMNGGTIKFGTAILNPTLDRNFIIGPSGATLTTSSSVNNTGLVSNINSSGGILTKNGSASLYLGRTSGNTYTGGTTVSAGNLYANNSTGSATGTGAVSVTGVLGGNGTASGSTTINSGGTITAGIGTSAIDQIGTLHVATASTSTNLTLSAGSTYLAKVTNLTSSPTVVTSDVLIMSGLSVALGDNPTILLVGTSNNNSSGVATGASPTFVNGQSFVIADVTNGLSATYGSGSAINSYFNINVSSGLATAGYTASEFSLSDAPDSINGGAGDDLLVTFNGTATAPEPTSLVLLAAVSSPLLLARRRRQMPAAANAI